MLFNSNKVNIIEAIIYLGLLTWTAYCVSKVFIDYSTGKTYFSKTFSEYVSDSDIPSVTLCMTAAKKLEYGRDFELQVARNGSESFMALKLGDNEVILKAHDSNISSYRIIELQKFSMYVPYSAANIFTKSCFAIHQTMKNSKSNSGKYTTILFDYFVQNLTL